MPYKTKELQREYQKQWIKNRRQEWLSKNGPCKQCGTWENLEIDHIDPKEKITHRIWSYNEEKRLKELAKCQVLCNECHIKKGIENGDILPRLVHGTCAMYRIHGCRCDVCTVFIKQYRHQEYLKRKKN